MNIVSSLEYGRSPFIPDKTRGHWASLTDYISAAIGVGFQLDMASIFWLYVFQTGALDIFPYILCLAVYAVPLMLLHSYLGQFSSSGYISALRVSPLFKGIGYIGLAINFCILTYLSSYATTPLFLFLHSLRPTLPWSCEGMTEWSTSGDHLCNETLAHGLREMANAPFSDKKFDYESILKVKVPSIMFYRHQFNIDEDLHRSYRNPQTLRFPWQLICCHLIVWALVFCVFKVLRSTEKFGRLLTILVGSTVALLVVCLVRFLCLPSVQWNVSDIFKFDLDLVATLLESPIIVLQIFGPGWGSMLSVASYNRFTTDIGRSAWLICGVQLLISGCFGLINSLIEGHLDVVADLDNYDVTVAFLDHAWSVVVSSGTVLAKLSYPNLWCLLYYGMVFLSAFVVLIIQVHSFFTALFDEFLYLRERKDTVIFGLLGLWAFLSLHQFSWIGALYQVYLSVDTQVVQQSLHLLLFMMLMWGYGHGRLRRDLEFMIGYRFPDWSVMIVCFVTPIILAFTVLIIIYYDIYMLLVEVTDLVGWVSVLCLVFPWLVFPYMIWYLMQQSTGPCLQRWRKICLPTDWYPVEHEDRRRYDEICGQDADGVLQQLDETIEP